MAGSPWYREGLSFSCTGCGHCCTGAPGYVWVSRGEIEALAGRLGLGVEAFGSRYLRRVGRRYSLVERPGGDCVFYEGGCTVYEDRPSQCRSYPFWPEVLESRETWEEECEECPGMGSGRFYALEEIEIIRRGGRSTPPGRTRDRDSGRGGLSESDGLSERQRADRSRERS